MAPPKSTVVAWNFVKNEGKNLLCQLCGHQFTGSLTRVVDHLLSISNGIGGGVEGCIKISNEQKTTVEKNYFTSKMEKEKREKKR